MYLVLRSMDELCRELQSINPQQRGIVPREGDTRVSPENDDENGEVTTWH